MPRRSSVALLFLSFWLAAWPSHQLVLDDSASNDGQCGVSKPLFQKKEKVLPMEGEEEDKNAWQRMSGTVLGWVGHLGLPWWHHEEMHEAEKPKKNESKLSCLMPYLMNCSSWDELGATNPCPEECPFVAQLKPFACALACVNASQCYYADVDAPFANPETLLCEHSVVEGCLVAADNVTQCRACRPHFSRSVDGTTCTYDREFTFIWVLEKLQRLGKLIWVVPVLLLVGMCWKLRKGYEENWELLTYARIHHHLCKVRKNPKIHSGAPLYSLCENLHTKFVIGVGLSLYYNSLVFLLILSLGLFGASYWVLVDGSGKIFQFAGSSATPVKVFGISLYPSVEGVSDASFCGWAMLGEDMLDVSYTSQQFMRRMAFTVLVLYVFVLAGMLIFAKVQLQHAEWFDYRYLTMKDFALRLRGFPPKATDEMQLQKFIQTQLGLDVHAVSIGYDFGKRRWEVQALIDRHLTYADSEARGSYPDRIGIPVMTRGEPRLGQGALDCGRVNDAAYVRRWFDEGSLDRMMSTGTVWVVFISREQRDIAFDTILSYGDNGFMWRDDCGVAWPIAANMPDCEPTNVIWGNLGISPCMRKVRLVVAAVLFFIACGLVACLVFLPYAAYVTSYISEAGSSPQGVVMGLLGVLIGLSWWLMSVVIGACIGFLGLETLEDEYLFTFIVFTIFCGLATSLNVYLTWYYTSKVWEDSGQSWMHFAGSYLPSSVNTLRALRLEIDFGFRVFQLLVPGVLFTPCLLGPLNNFIVPYIRESSLLLLFGRGIFEGRGGSGREAERYLEPLPIGLAWDYPWHVIQPFVCCLTFFIMSPAMWWAQAYLCAWCIFFYFFQRVMHLRVQKKMYYTSSKLDRIVIYVGFGLVLAELAACHAYWQVRLQEWHPRCIITLTLSSTLLYCTLLRFAVGLRWPMTSEFDRMKRLCYGGESSTSTVSTLWSCEDYCYNWLNVNPVYVLKSQYCDDLLGGADKQIFYDPGKEYLQLFCSTSPVNSPHNPRNARWNTHKSGLWLELEGLGIISPLLQSEDFFLSAESTDIADVGFGIEAGTEAKPLTRVRTFTRAQMEISQRRKSSIVPREQSAGFVASAQDRSPKELFRGQSTAADRSFAAASIATGSTDAGLTAADSTVAGSVVAGASDGGLANPILLPRGADGFAQPRAPFVPARASVIASVGSPASAAGAPALAAAPPATAAVAADAAPACVAVPAPLAAYVPAEAAEFEWSDNAPGTTDEAAQSRTPVAAAGTAAAPVASPLALGDLAAPVAVVPEPRGLAVPSADDDRDRSIGAVAAVQETGLEGEASDGCAEAAETVPSEEACPLESPAAPADPGSSAEEVGQEGLIAAPAEASQTAREGGRDAVFEDPRLESTSQRTAAVTFTIEQSEASERHVAPVWSTETPTAYREANAAMKQASAQLEPVRQSEPLWTGASAGEVATPGDEVEWSPFQANALASAEISGACDDPPKIPQASGADTPPRLDRQDCEAGGSAPERPCPTEGPVAGVAAFAGEEQVQDGCLEVGPLEASRPSGGVMSSAAAVAGSGHPAADAGSFAAEVAATLR